jgi:putative nucleotidyltransferase with HDIG domain
LSVYPDFQIEGLRQTMKRLMIFVDSDHSVGVDSIRRDFGSIFDLQFYGFDRIRDVAPGRFQIFDINLSDGARLEEIKKWAKARPKDSKLIIAVDKTSRAEKIQAYALGATDIIHRPVTGGSLQRVLLAEFNELAVDACEPSLASSPAAGAALQALENTFSSACLGAPVDFATINSAGEELVACIEAQGLGSWIGNVRRHHSQTYRHSLIVTGVAVAFGQNLGFSTRDRERLSFAGMLHDIGKARIPIAILEKNGPLDSVEMAIMRKHPEYGFDALRSVKGLSSLMLDMVVHHHEYLDGTGYPHGLRGHEISDLVRIMTISDIFGALIEQRSYRPAMPAGAAYQVLLEMGPKLDEELVREFRFAEGLTIVEPSRQAAPHNVLFG